jgi:hypothetical protein
MRSLKIVMNYTVFVVSRVLLWQCIRFLLILLKKIHNFPVMGLKILISSPDLFISHP